MRAQISIEYLVILGMTLGILIPAVFFFYTYSRSDAGTTTSAQINDIGLRMVSMTKSTYASGSGAWQTLDFIMPETVTNVTAAGNELVITYDTAVGPSQAVFFSNIPFVTSSASGLVSETHPGRTKYRFTAQGTAVNITETT